MLSETIISMLVTDVGDEMCWWHFEDFGDSLGYFGQQHPLYVTNIEILSPTSKNCHQRQVTNIFTGITVACRDQF